MCSVEGANLVDFVTVPPTVIENNIHPPFREVVVILGRTAGASSGTLPVEPRCLESVRVGSRSTTVDRVVDTGVGRSARLRPVAPLTDSHSNRYHFAIRLGHHGDEVAVV